MDSLVLRPFKLRFFFCLLLVGLIAFQFWTTSRYPSLNEKAMMSGAIQLEDPLSFEAMIELRPEYPVWKRIGISTVNWIDTNLQGMTFGILFGAAILTLFSYMQRHSFKGRFANAFAGLGFGAPLGVCVNCAAPIARALYSGGTRAEVALSAMIASPTLNIVVLTMLFSILPFYMAITKIVLSLFVIIVAVPIICMFLPEREVQHSKPSNRSDGLPHPVTPGINETALNSAIRFARDFLANLIFISIRTVPLMLLAGFLGAAVATLIPTDVLNNSEFGILMLLIVATVGTFLPVPIGFDVVVSGALLGGGLEPGFVMTLLFTLGVFSVYSFFIVASGISSRAAVMMTVLIIVTGVFAGIAAQLYKDYQTNRALKTLISFDLGLISSAQASEYTPIHSQETDGTKIEVFRKEYAAKPKGSDNRTGPNFKRLEAWKIGIDQPIEFSFAYMWPPFWEGRGITSGDFDRDGDVDIIIGSTVAGLHIYENGGAGKFIRSDQSIGNISNLPVFNVAMVDIDNDGWLDLFITTYQQGNFVVPNKSGQFDHSAMYEVANRPDAILTLAAGFGDINRDGELDVVLGNWAAGWYRRVPGEESRNRIVLGKNGRITGQTYSDLPGLPGETLSTLVSDVDGNGKLDLLVANDFEQPDYFYMSNERGQLSAVTRGSNRIPKTTTTTMSIKSADLDNDGLTEIYLAQIAGRSSGISEKLKLQPLNQYCDRIERPKDRKVCSTNMEIKSWYRSGNNFNPTYASKCQELDPKNRDECKAMLIKDIAIQNKDPSLCELIPAQQTIPRQYCDIHFQPISSPTEEQLASTIPQILRRNVLLSYQKDGTFREEAIERGLDVGGWSWDVKIGDFNNDGWQDVFIVNGTWVPNEVSPSNLMFMNKGDGTFAEVTTAWGLEDYLITASALLIDLENDGDLDIISVPVNGPIMAYLNQSEMNQSITFEFEDELGNQSGIGNVIKFNTGDNSLGNLSREIQSSGGFMSFDVAQAHFGLGKQTEVQNISIYWSDGSKANLTVTLKAGGTYLIRRTAQQ